MKSFYFCRMTIYLLDKFDSFTYNLKHYIDKLGHDVIIERNDDVNWGLIETADAIVLSPGPGLPKDAGKMMEVIEKFVSSKKMLGVCLGHQALGEYFGGRLYNMKEVMHGKEIEVEHTSNSIFSGIQSPQKVGLYHSWAVEINNTKRREGASWKDTAMAFQHKDLPVFGVQFHPESILTQDGLKIISNLLNNTSN